MSADYIPKEFKQPFEDPFSTLPNLSHFSLNSMAGDESSNFAARTLSPSLSIDTIRTGPCQQCPCVEGLFNDSEGICTSCSHAMPGHSPDPLQDRFGTNAEHLIHRTDLVNALIKDLKEKRVIVIRAPPRVGKSTVLNLIGREMIQNHPDLEPIDLFWKPRTAAEIRHESYQDILRDAEIRAKKQNEKTREKLGLTKPWSSTTSVFMIDDAVETYNETDMWDQLFKNEPAGLKSCYLLICVHGSSDGTHRWGKFPSQSAKIPSNRRIELYPTSTGGLQMLLNKQEIRQLVDRWAEKHSPRAKCEQSVYDFIESETQGHVGVISKLLHDVQEAAKNEPDRMKRNENHYDALRVRQLMGQNCLTSLSETRGFWNQKMEFEVQTVYLPILLTANDILDKFRGLTFENIRSSMNEVAVEQEGYTIDAVQSQSMTASSLEACHQIGLLQSQHANGKITYMFPSRIHQRVALERIYPNRVAAPSLPDLCIKAMQRFNPSALTSRKEISGDQWSIPEAAFQAEMYAALKSELIGSQICSEYSQDRTGRIDFWLPDEAWGIEILQNGTLDAIEDHTINRFQFDENLDLCGKYRRWGILKDFVIINFCFGAKHRDLRNKDLNMDPEVFSKTFQVVYNEESSSMKVYKADHTLACDIFYLEEGKHLRLVGGCFPG